MAESLQLIDVLRRTEDYLRERGVDQPRLEAELLLAKVLALDRLKVYLQHDRPLTQAELEALRALVRRRGRREPFAWIVGSQGFHRVELSVRPGVLVPRPDTEALVEAAVEWIGDVDPVYIADVGCGSGAIGLAVATELPGARVYAVDLSAEALETTRENVARLGLGERVAVLEGDLLGPIPARRPVDWVLSNPPYIPSGEIDALMPEVSRHEPRLALDGGADGLAVYRRLLPEARRRARRGALVEVGAHQAGRVADLFRQAGFVDVRTWKDLAGIDRVVGGRVP